MSCSIESIKPPLGICQPQPLGKHFFGGAVGWQTRSIVSYLNTKGSVLRFRQNFDQSWSRAWGNTVTDCVFDNRLQNQVGHPGVECGRTHVDTGREAVLKSNSFDFQIALQEFHFLLKRDFLTSGILESKAQKVAQTSNHRAGGFGLLVE